MKTQAERVREMVVDILTDDTNIYRVPIDGTRFINGISFSDLKRIVMESDDEFTEGGVTGALTTIVDRIPQVKRINVRSRSYYFYSSSEENIDMDIHVVESFKFNELNKSINKSQEIMKEILIDLGKDHYKDLTDIDINSLRVISSKIDSLIGTVNSYQADKYLELIQSNMDNR